MAKKQTIRWKFERVAYSHRPRGVAEQWRGTLTLPPMVFPSGKARRVAITATGPDKATALKKSAAGLQSLLDNPLVKAALPPGTGVAAAALSRVAEAAGVPGALDKAWKSLKGPGAKRLVSAVKKIWPF